jgi:hypothetical protein
MKYVVGSMVGAGVLAGAQLGASSLDQMIGQEMGMSADMVQTAVQSANAALGAGPDASWVILAVAAMPVVFHLSKAGMAMVQAEHEYSIAKRRKAAGLDRSTSETE